MNIYSLSSGTEIKLTNPVFSSLFSILSQSSVRQRLLLNCFYAVCLHFISTTQQLPMQCIMHISIIHELSIICYLLTSSVYENSTQHTPHFTQSLINYTYLLLHNNAIPRLSNASSKKVFIDHRNIISGSHTPFLPDVIIKY